MKKFFKIFSVFFIIIITGCLLLAFEINSSAYDPGIEGNRIHFKTPDFMVQIINGKPDKVTEYSVSGAKEYVYHEQTLFGRQGSIHYHSLFGVNEVNIEIPVEAGYEETVFNEIGEYMCNVYSKKRGYYDEGIRVNEATGGLIHRLGADFGATGISVMIEYEEKQIRVYTHYQY